MFHFYKRIYNLELCDYIITEGREISGAPSRHGVTGRERILYTTWQGNKAPVLEQGAAALLAVDQGGVNNSTTSSAQALVCQGQESPAFVTMLPGPCVILAGFRDQEFEGKPFAIYVCVERMVCVFCN